MMATERTLRELPDGDNCDVPKHAGDLLISVKHISLVNIIPVTWKLICASYVAFHTELKHVIRIALSPSFRVTEFLKCNFSEFHFFFMLPVRYKYDWRTLLYFKLSVGM